MISPKISLPEIEVFLEVCRLKSLKETGRQLSLRTSSLSKIISKIERTVGAKLFSRSMHGMEMTPEGLQFHRAARKVMSSVPEMDFKKAGRTPAVKQKKLCSIGSISFLSSQMIAAAVARISARQKDYRFRIVEFDHTHLLPYGLRGAFDAAVHIGELEWTRAWHSTELMDLSWGLFGRYGHPLGTRCSQAEALSFPFVAT